MTLAPQQHVFDAAVDTIEVRYEWDDWDVQRYFRPGDAELADRALALSHRARIALCLAIGEWIVHRYIRLAGVYHPLCSDYFEALWAWSIDWRYAVPFRPIDREWLGPIIGPLEAALVICNEAFDICEEQGPTELYPAFMSQLAEHVLPDRAPFREWRDAAVDRLELHFAWEYDELDFFLEHDFRGARVPRELFDLRRPFDPKRSDDLLRAYLVGLQRPSNPFLRSLEELEELASKGEPPYLYPP